MSNPRKDQPQGQPRKEQQQGHLERTSTSPAGSKPTGESAAHGNPSDRSPKQQRAAAPKEVCSHMPRRQLIRVPLLGAHLVPLLLRM